LFLSVCYGQMIGRGPAYTSVTTGPADTLGSEMISNGAFDDGTDWTAGTGWSIGSGVASYDNTIAANLTQAAVDMVSNLTTTTLYRLTFNMVISSYHGHVQIKNAAGNVNFTSMGDINNGLVVIRFTTGADVAGGGFRIYADALVNPFTIDNVSLKKVL
jgi:hypothetical protein